MFAQAGHLFQVTSESDIELMETRRYDPFSLPMIIDSIPR
jgi:hypothetical protein